MCTPLFHVWCSRCLCQASSKAAPDPLTPMQRNMPGWGTAENAEWRAGAVRENFPAQPLQQQGPVLTTNFVRGANAVGSVNSPLPLKLLRTGSDPLGCPPAFYCTVSVALLWRYLLPWHVLIRRPCKSLGSVRTQVTTSHLLTSNETETEYTTTILDELDTNTHQLIQLGNLGENQQRKHTVLRFKIKVYLKDITFLLPTVCTNL